jgi:hypothetical protein
MVWMYSLLNSSVVHMTVLRSGLLRGIRFWGLLPNKRNWGFRKDVSCKSQAWLCMPTTPTTLEVEIGRSGFEATLGKSFRPYLKHKLKTKEPGHGWSSGLAYQTQGLELNPQHYLKNKQTRKWCFISTFCHGRSQEVSWKIPKCEK